MEEKTKFSRLFNVVLQGLSWDDKKMIMNYKDTTNAEEWIRKMQELSSLISVYAWEE